MSLARRKVSCFLAAVLLALLLVGGTINASVFAECNTATSTSCSG